MYICAFLFFHFLTLFSAWYGFNQKTKKVGYLIMACRRKKKHQSATFFFSAEDLIDLRVAPQKLWPWYCDLDLYSYDLWPWPLRPFTFNLVTLTLKSTLKTEMLHFDLDLRPWPLSFVTLTLLTLILDLSSYYAENWNFYIFWPWWPWPLTYDLDLQSRPRYVGPWNVSWILGL